MDAGLFHAFATEFLKLATVKLQDADIRELVADREGREKYLPGGQLPTNSLGDGGSGYVTKLSTYGSDPIRLASGAYDLKSRKKRHGVYQSARDYAVTGMKGGLTGLGLLGAGKALKGDFRSATEFPHIAKKQARRFAAAGALISMADRAYRHAGVGDAEKTAMVQPTPGRTFKTPDLAFDAGRRTGGFKSEVVHGMGKPPKLLQLGHKFIRR